MTATNKKLHRLKSYPVNNQNFSHLVKHLVARLFFFVFGILDSISEMSLLHNLLAVHCNTRFSHQAIVRGAIGLMTAGCCDFADIKKFSGEAMFRHLVGKDIPSQETFRQRLNQLALIGWTPVVDDMAAPISSRRRRPSASSILSSAIRAARTRCSCRTASAAAENRNFRVPKRPSTAALAEKTHLLSPFGHCRI